MGKGWNESATYREKVGRKEDLCNHGDYENPERLEVTLPVDEV
jgi:hypothetical protein